MKIRTGLLALLAVLALALSHGGSARAQQTCVGANCSAPNPEPSPATGTGDWVRATSPTLSGTVTLSSGATMVLPTTTFASQGGILYKASNQFLHDFNYGNNGTVTTQGRNLFLGLVAGNFTSGSAATLTYQASDNVGLGYATLFSNTTGYRNTGIGSGAVVQNTTGYNNTGLGYDALLQNTNGYGNTAVGALSLYGATGYGNIGIGASPSTPSQFQVTTGNRNISIGHDVAVASATADNQLNIGNLIYGTGLDGTTSTISSGNIGIGVKAPDQRLTVDGAARLVSIAFASLGTPANGTQAYCADCTQTTPYSDTTCVGGGTGAMAYRLNGAWKCFN